MGPTEDPLNDGADFSIAARNRLGGGLYERELQHAVTRG